jgi:hypothetical protein
MTMLMLAYVVSVHKAHGSEFPMFVMPVLTQPYMILHCKLLYTAVTRAHKLCTRSSSINMTHPKLKDSATDTCTPWHRPPGQVCVRCKCYTDGHGFLN